ncbi:MAG TPA: TIGR04283 family arsenosugar biosynthesis glycosyltransferase [Candidatus Thermoplasmatota archaeon]|nr:TIGR04283 family arsenosugar biosynthesis glycosyltransferase [Candidatus Thermoplasmatota archaeon]
MNEAEPVIRSKVSIVIPVLHEREIIIERLEQLKTLKNPPFYEVIVVDGSSTQDTLETIQEDDIIRLSSKPGRGHQMNQGAAAATGDILLFLHADTSLPTNALQCIEAALRDELLVGGAFNHSIDSSRFIYKVLSFLIFFRSRLTRVPFGDQVIFLRKSYFDVIHGYKETPLMEDVELMRRIRRTGGKIVLLRERVVTSPRRWEREGVVLCTFRNWTIRMLYLLGVSPDRLVRFYIRDER